MIRDWLGLAWNVDGMAYEQYLKLGQVERHAMHTELCEMVDRANPPPVDGEDDDPKGGSGGGGRQARRAMRR